MNRVTWLGLMISMAMLGSVNTAQGSSAGFVWEYDQYRIAADGSRSPLARVKYYLADRTLRIDGEDGTVIIDYGAQRLYRRNPGDKSYAEFSLDPGDYVPTGVSEKDSEIRQTLIDTIGTVDVVDGEEQQNINNVPCRKMHLAFGRRMNLHRTVIPIEIEVLGRKFRAHSAIYWVSQEIAVFGKILKIAAERESFFQSTPLLRQIDPLGLMKDLGGFPLRIEQHDRDGQLTIRVLSFIEAQALNPRIFSPSSDSSCKDPLPEE